MFSNSPLHCKIEEKKLFFFFKHGFNGTRNKTHSGSRRGSRGGKGALAPPPYKILDPPVGSL